MYRVGLQEGRVVFMKLVISGSSLSGWTISDAPWLNPRYAEANMYLNIYKMYQYPNVMTLIRSQQYWKYLYNILNFFIIFIIYYIFVGANSTGTEEQRLGTNQWRSHSSKGGNDRSLL